jgi:hypothetical protein
MWAHTRAKAGAGLDREESIKKSAARAKAQCRLVCKTMLVNSLWTLAAVGEHITSTWWDQGRQCFFIETDDTGRPPDVIE